MKLVDAFKIGLMLMLLGSGALADGVALKYVQITDPIISATFSADFSAMNTHRTDAGTEAKLALLIDMTGSPGDYEAFNSLFGIFVEYQDILLPTVLWQYLSKQ